MRIDIFDVGHGACCVITGPDGKRIMIDCGCRSDEPYWWPSIHFFGQRMEALILSNLDEDHVSNFRSTWQHVTLGTIWSNPTIDVVRLRALKPDGMRDGVSAVHEYLQKPTALNLTFDLSEVAVISYYNSYGTFTNTNNLSLVTFVEYGHFSIMFPGDIEEGGWKALLLNPDFAARLRRVNIFVASHHGRENGCCAEVFSHALCNPHAFVISDKEVVHDSQETGSWYRQHARGLQKILASPWDLPETRYVFTTRTDCNMSIIVQPNGNFVLYPKSNIQKASSSLPLALKASAG
jgi:beta-lactamase superfamily II metal-dependent hydrolase